MAFCAASEVPGAATLGTLNVANCVVLTSAAIDGWARAGRDGVNSISGAAVVSGTEGMGSEVSTNEPPEPLTKSGGGSVW